MSAAWGGQPPGMPAGAAHWGRSGIGVPGSVFAGTGQHGASPIYNDLDPGDATREIRWRILSGPSRGTFAAATETGEVEIAGVTDGDVTFTYQVWTDNVLGVNASTGLDYATASITVGTASTPADTTAPAWTGSTLTESAVTTTGCTVSWPAATDAGSVLYRWRIGSGAWTTTTSTSAAINGQTAGATLAFEVQAYDNATPPNYSASLTKSIALQQPQASDTQPPTWPAGAQISVSTPTTTSYTATAPTATDDSGGAITYRWTRGGAVLTGVTGTSYTRTGATPGSTEALTVVALDPTGNPGSTLSTSVTLAAADPTPVPVLPFSVDLVKRWARISDEFDELLPMMISGAIEQASHSTGNDYMVQTMPYSVQQYVCATVAYWVDNPAAQGSPAPHLERLLDPHRSWGL